MNDLPGQIPEPAPALGAPPTNWRSALIDLVGSRIALVRLEMKDAARSGIRRTIFLAAAALLLLLGWIILVAGLVGLIAVKGGHPWYLVTLCAAGIHLLLAIIFVAIARRPAAPSFEITRQEFKKDREWLQNFQSPGKSND